MDSPYLQSSSADLQRMRSNSSLSAQSIDSRGAIRKRSLSRVHQLSSAKTDRLHQFALDQINQANGTCFQPTLNGNNWITPQHSPQPNTFSEPGIEPFPQWTVPTPPHSDSGIPALPVDVDEEVTAADTSSTGDFSFVQPRAAAEMSSLGFLLPSQYGSGSIESEPGSYTMDPNYIPPVRMSQPATTSGNYAYTQPTSSPGLYQSRTMPSAPTSSSTAETGRRHSELPGNTHGDPAYHQSYRRVSSPYSSTGTGDYGMSGGQTIPSISGLVQSPAPSPHLGTSSGPMSNYSSSMSRSPNMYDQGMYGQGFPSQTPPASHMYGSGQSMSYPPAPFVGSSVNDPMETPRGGHPSSIRVLNQRPKPQCWEHGCNGRQFSTFSNLLRHQREKSGTASKSYCPKCGAEFTRTTARNGHLAHDKCTKQSTPSDEQ